MLQPVRVIDPRVRFRSNQEKERIVLEGGTLYTQYVEPASSLSDQNANFQINIQSQKTAVDRNFELRAYVEFVFNDVPQVGTNDAPRAFPLASVMENLDARINGTNNNDQVSDRIHTHLMFNNDALKRERHWSKTPAMPDQFQDLADWTTYGSARNPLSAYGENSAELSRGGFEPVSVSTDGKTYRYIFTEPLFLSPFLQGEQEEAMVNINDIIINITWKQNLSIMWSHSSAGAPITSVVASFYQKPEILYTQITPNMSVQLPEIQLLPYVKIDQFPRTIDAPVGAGVRVDGIVSNAIQIKEIPRYLLLFVRRSRATTTFLTTDTLARIDRVVVNWDNQSFLFNTTTSQQLYDMAVSNGCNLSYVQWTKHVGSPVLLEFGTQIGLKDGEAPSVLGSWTISATIDFTNTSQAPVNYEFFMCFIRHGIITIGNGSCVFSLGTLTRQEALDSKISPSLPVEYSDLQGGGVWSKSRSFINKLSRGVNKFGDVAVPIVSQLAPSYAPAIMAGQQISKQIQKGTGGRMSGGMLSGGMLSGGMLSGGCCAACGQGMACEMDSKQRFKGRRGQY